MTTHRNAIIGFTSATALLVAIAPQAAAQISLISPTINNGSFELPAAGKIQNGYDGTPNDIPNWRNTGGIYTDTGIEIGGSTDGSYYSFHKAQEEGGAFQITNYAIQTGDQFTLSWSARDIWQSPTQTVALLTASTQTDAYGLTTPVATTQNIVAIQAYTLYTMNYTATAADAGKLIGVSFESTDDTGGSYIGFDNFQLSVTPVPEPSSLVSLLSGIGLLAGFKRRRAARI